MKKDIKDKFPKWCNSNEQFDLCLTNDIDSLLSCAILKEIKGYNINYFYDFSNLYRIKKTQNPAIGIDMALTKGKCWDNHVTLLSNNKSANINSILGINRNNYCKKYAMSTLLTIMSYYNIPLPPTIEGQMILLAIDSSYLGHYNNYFKPIHNKFLRTLEYDELIEILDHHTKDDFIEVIKRYNLDKPIQIKKNKLITKINLPELEGFFNVHLSLPNDEFTKIQNYKYCSINLKENKFKNTEDIFSLALTYKNKIVLSKGKNMCLF
jgi:hypothetical protein